MTGPTPVAFVAGTGRSGSTVYANVIGQLPGCVSVGELRYVWERGLVENRLCGCGEAFGDCPFWTTVLKRAFDGAVPDPRAMMRLQAGPTKLRALPRMLLPQMRLPQVMPGRRKVPPGPTPSGLGDLPDHLSRIYAAVLAVSGGRVVVDSSKLPSYANLLASFPALDVTVLHLVRDPRAAAFSWKRRKEQPDRRTPGLMERRGVGKSVALWWVWNAALELMWRRRPGRYLRTTYEGFVADPAAAIAQVADILDAGPVPADLFPSPGTVSLGPNHTVAGNPARLKHGEIRLKLDDEWRRSMPRRDRALVTLAAAPLMWRYGYLARR